MGGKLGKLKTKMHVKTTFQIENIQDDLRRFSGLIINCLELMIMDWLH